ncbi:kynurenine/alpha-aminoadipate aminotransferase, mitochondrial-like isoform X2 [Lineus longissimus]|uniref:kynurenine/alpha-aminoadipate aminotransferase, mitochondrial-like isoform X2 n=1 Tax=Lineus longissimus TaxID=88925 RepID=UPI002B4ED8D6
MNYTRFLTATSLARKPSPIRFLTEILAKSPPSMISLAAGQPNPSMFPFKESSFVLRDGTSIELDETSMNIALQYGSSKGYDPLLSWLRELQKKLHDPPLFNSENKETKTDLCMVSGSQDGLSKAFDMLVSRGDNVLVEIPCYPGTLTALRPKGANLIGVETDHQGMKPSSLREALSKWKPEDSKDPLSDIPKILYTVPNGGNPTGMSTTENRKKEIYQIAHEYDILIVEDDPYYFLQFNEVPIPSYLSLDIDGRVLRMDSFSKIISSGMRIAVVTAPSFFLEKLVAHMQVAGMHADSLSQVVITKLFHQWGMDGLLQHVNMVKGFYKDQKDAMILSAEKHLSGLAEWHEPLAGMFLWVKLKQVNDTNKLIMEKAIEKEVLLTPGNAFMINDQLPSPYLRAAFSLATPEKMDKGFERLSLLIKEEINANQQNK